MLSRVDVLALSLPPARAYRPSRVCCAICVCCMLPPPPVLVRLGPIPLLRTPEARLKLRLRLLRLVRLRMLRQACAQACLCSGRLVLRQACADGQAGLCSGRLGPLCLLGEFVGVVMLLSLCREVFLPVRRQTLAVRERRQRRSHHAAPLAAAAKRAEALRCARHLDSAGILSTLHTFSPAEGQARHAHARSRVA